MSDQPRRAASFGELAPLIAPRSVAVIGASDREGNVGGMGIGLLRKFGYQGPIWPVNPGRTVVAEIPCFPAVSALPGVPDLALLAVSAEGVASAVADRIASHVPAAVVWAGGFAEVGGAGIARQRQVEELCRGQLIKLCGPNCVGIINPSICLIASFGSQLNEIDHLRTGAVSMISQSGGVSLSTHVRAERMGFGFRVTISCGNEAALSIPHFIRALCQDDETRVIAIYLEALSDPPGFIDALTEARRQQKPLVILKAGASKASGRAALVHTGRLAEADCSYDAIFREFGVIRVYSPDELLDVSLQLAAWRPAQAPAGNQVVLASFGGGNGVISADLCFRQGLDVPALDTATQEKLEQMLPAVASVINPVDLTPGAINNPTYRVHLPNMVRTIADGPEAEQFILLVSGLGKAAPVLTETIEGLGSQTEKPTIVGWQLAPPGIGERLAANGIFVFDEHSRAIRTASYLARFGRDIRHRIQCRRSAALSFPWQEFVPRGIGRQVIPENVTAAILERARLPVAKGLLARTTENAITAAAEVGYPVAIKGISPAITHRAAAGLVALNLQSAEAVARTDKAFRTRAAQLGVELEGIWVQHMALGAVEMLVTAFRDKEFGVIVGCGLGGAMTEVIDDVVFARAPIDVEGSSDLIGYLRILKRLPGYLDGSCRDLVVGFLARFSALAASAPWETFTFEINPIKANADAVSAVDGLLVIE